MIWLIFACCNIILEVPMMEEQGKETIISDEKDEEVVEEEEVVESNVDSSNDEADDKVDEALQEEIATLTEEFDQLKDRYLRAQAEFENFKKRTEKEKVAERKYKSQDLAIELLPVMDNFERALETEVSEENKGFVEGIQMVYNQFKEALKSQGIEEIDTDNKAFDPNMHHAVKIGRASCREGVSVSVC